MTAAARARAGVFCACLLLYLGGMAGCSGREAPSSDAVPSPRGAAALVLEGDAALESARASLSPEDYQRAQDAFEAALRAQPDSALALSGLARVYNGRHEFEAGMAFARQALAIDPLQADAHALLGDAAVELGDYPLAFEHYQQALDLRPDLGTYGRAAWLLWLTSDAQRGRRLMRRAIAAGSERAEHVAWSRARLAQMLFHAGALVQAEATVDRGLEQAPHNAHLLSEKGRLRLAQGDYAGAERYYLRSVEAAPTHDALAGLELLYRLDGRQDAARQQFARVVAFHARHVGDLPGAASGGEPEPGHLHGDHELARFYADRDRNLGRARWEAAEAWRRTPNVLVADTLAWCLYKVGEYEEAAKMIEVALGHDTPLADIHFHAGTIYARLGERDRARRHLQRALDLNEAFHPEHAAVTASMLGELAAAQSPGEHGEVAHRSR